jgi:hypothetical protein
MDWKIDVLIARGQLVVSDDFRICLANILISAGRMRKLRYPTRAPANMNRISETSPIPASFVALMIVIAAGLVVLAIKEQTRRCRRIGQFYYKSLLTPCKEHFPATGHYRTRDAFPYPSRADCDAGAECVEKADTHGDMHVPGKFTQTIVDASQNNERANGGDH